MTNSSSDGYRYVIRRLYPYGPWSLHADNVRVTGAAYEWRVPRDRFDYRTVTERPPRTGRGIDGVELNRFDDENDGTRSVIVDRDCNPVNMEGLSRGGKTTVRQEHERESALPRVPGHRVFLIRHADAKEGPKDPDRGMHLSAIGQRQAQALAKRLANWQIDAILSSDMHRAHETAAAVHSFHPDVPLIVDATFREVSAGTTTG
jgi:hypothetical protein